VKKALGLTTILAMPALSALVSGKTLTFSFFHRRNMLFPPSGYTIQEAQLMQTTGAMRLAVSRGQQTWYHFGSVATFR